MLGMQPSTSIYLENHAKLTETEYNARVASGDTVRQAELSLVGNSTEINIRYGTTEQAERQRYVIHSRYSINNFYADSRQYTILCTAVIILYYIIMSVVPRKHLLVLL